LEQVRTELKDFTPTVVESKAVEKEEFFEGDEEELAEALPEVESVSANPNPGADILGVDTTDQAEQQSGGALEEDRSIILTSDQKVLLISLRKEKVLSSLQSVMKSVAVDCEMNLPDNYDGSYKCAALDGNIGDFAYHPDLQKDIQETEARFKKAPIAQAVQAVQGAEIPVAPVVKPKKVEYRKKEYYYKVKKDVDGKVLGYLFYSIDDAELKIPIGFVKPHPVTGMPKGDVLPVPEGY